MPRITGPNIAEHVAAQKSNVVSAARSLFSQRGVGSVSLADIAAEVGLGRTALYRYFPTKAHILMAWFDQEMDGLVVAADAALKSASTPEEALERWLEVQLDFLTDTEHRSLSDATATAGTLPPDVAAHFGARHRELYSELDKLLAQATADSGVRRHRVILIAGLIRSSAESMDRGQDSQVVRAELLRSALAVAALSGPPPQVLPFGES